MKKNFNQEIMELKELQERLETENEKLRTVLEKKSLFFREMEKRSLYKYLEQKLDVHIEKLERLLEETEAIPEPSGKSLARICVLGAFIKRYANLLLEKKECVSSIELEYCIREVMDCLKMMNVQTYLDSSCDGEISVKNALKIFSFYGQVTEYVIEEISAVFVHVVCRKEKIQLRLQIGCTNMINPKLIEKIVFDCGTLQCEIYDEDMIIDVAIT